MTKSEKDNVLNFPSNLSQAEKEVEALLFAAAEPLDIETIQAKITKKNVNVCFPYSYFRTGIFN